MTIYEYIAKHSHCAINNIPSDIAFELVNTLGVNLHSANLDNVNQAIRYSSKISLRFFDGLIAGYSFFGGYHITERYGSPLKNLDDVTDISQLSVLELPELNIDSLI